MTTLHTKVKQVPGAGKLRVEGRIYTRMETCFTSGSMFDLTYAVGLNKLFDKALVSCSDHLWLNGRQPRPGVLPELKKSQNTEEKHHMLYVSPPILVPLPTSKTSEISRHRFN